MKQILSEKLACAYFFILPALVYGILSARLPAFRVALSLDNSQIGALLLSLGLATLIGLVAADMIIEKFSAKIVTSLSGLLVITGIILASCAGSYRMMQLILFITGLFVGLCDVGMNALGIFLEQRHKIYCLSFLHACSSIGGACGACTGFLFSAFGLGAFWNFFIVLGLFLCGYPLAVRFLPADKGTSGSHSLREFSFRLPRFILFCGVMSLICHIVEGSAGEWGSILLVTIKGSSQQTAALVFAVFTGSMIISRLFTDAARRKITDFHIVLAGSLGGFIGMAIALLAPLPWQCLCGYGIMGLTVAPVTPVLFSRAGDVPNISPGKASASISIFSYAGLLFFPPFFGMLGEAWGLVNALWLIAIFCLIMALGSLILKKAPHAA